MGRVAARILLVAWLAALPASGGVIFRGDYESGGPGGFSEDIEGNGEYEIVTVPEPVRAGRYSCKFMLHRARRVELVPRGATAPIGSERWYGFSIYIPADWSPASRKDEVVAQWHATPDRDEGEAWRSPPLAVRTLGNMWQVTCRWDSKHISNGNSVEGSIVLWSGPIELGRWTDWVFHVKWSWQEDGLLEVWKNGELLKRRQGPNCYNDKGGLYFKWGIYHTLEERTLYNDELRIADERGSYQMVAPPGSRIPASARAAAGRRQLRWEKDLAAAKERARREGRPVFVLLTGDGEAAETFEDEEVKEALLQLVCVRLEAAEGRALGERLGPGASAGAGMMDPDGGVLCLRAGAPRREDVLALVREGLEKFGPVLGRGGVLALERRLERARRYLAGRRYERALRELSRLQGVRWGPGKEAEELRRRIEEKAKAALDEALRTEKTSPQKARVLYEKIKRDFAGLAAAREAGRRLDALAERGVIDMDKVRVKANALYKKGLRLEGYKRYAEAIALYRKVCSLPSTEYTGMAKAAIERLEKDPEVARAIERAEVEKEARALLSRARMWERNEREDEARELYQELLRDYPDTTAADEAAAALDRLRW